MSGSVFRYRGVSVVIDTTEPAEFDIQGYQIPDNQLESYGRELRDVLISDRDRVFGDVRVRRFDAFDFIYFFGQSGEKLVITICGVALASDAAKTERLLEKMGTAAILRGATGL